MIAAPVLAACTSPDGMDASVASYDGGKITVADVCSSLSNPALMEEVGSAAQSPAKEIEDVARKLAARRILVSYAKEHKLDKTPEYLLDSKLATESVLADLLMDSLRKPSTLLNPSEETVRAFYDANRDNINPGITYEQIHDELVREIRYQQGQKAVDEALEKATASYPLKCAPDPPEPKPGEPKANPADKPVVISGFFAVTRGELELIGRRTGASVAACKDAIEFLSRGDAARDIVLAQQARSSGVDKQPQFTSNLAVVSDGILGRLAREELIRKWIAEPVFSEDDLKKAYDSDWKATVDPELVYDAAIVPVIFSQSDFEPAREAARVSAEASARRIINRVESGDSLEAAVKSVPGASILKGQRRMLNEEDPFYATVSSVKPGQIASEPLYDLGGMCVIRVKSFAMRQKTPYEMAKRYVDETLRRSIEQDIRDNFEEHLLGRSGFRMDKRAAEKIVR